MGPSVILSVIGGTVAGALGRFAPSDAAVVALACLSVAVVSRRWRVLLLVTALCAGAAAHAATRRERVLASPLAAWFDAAVGQERSVVVTVSGVLAADAAPAELGVRLVMDVRAVETPGQPAHPVSGRLRVHVGGALTSGAWRAWTAGREIRAPVSLRHPETLWNPGQPSPRWQRLTRRIDLVGSVKSAVLVEVRPASVWHEAAAGIRAGVRDRVSRLFRGERAESGAIVTAVLVGDRSGLDDDVSHRLQAAGTYHVIAISGGNVAMLTALGVFALRRVLRSPRGVTATAIMGVLAYGWIVGGEPSVARAVLAAVVYLACGFAGLAPPPVRVVLVVGLILVAVDPLTVVDVGAWLSFGATLALLAVAAPLSSRVMPGPLRVRDAIWRVIVGTAAVETALLPIAAFTFTRVGVAGLVLNVVALPAMAVVQVTGLVAVILVNAWPWAASVCAVVADVAARALVGSASLVDIVPWLTWRVPRPPLALVATYYAAVASALLAYWRAAEWRRGAAIVAALMGVAIAGAPWLPLAAPRAGVLRVTVIDVGQGDAILLQFPTGHALLVDAGLAGPSFDVGDRVVAPVVWASGVRRLDWLAVTHADADHAGGAASALALLRPREIWEGIPVTTDARRTALRQRAEADGVVWRTLQHGHALSLGGVELRVLHPPRPDWERRRVRNDDSLVLCVRYGDVEVLLTGDIGAEVEAALDLETPASVRVLKVAHHGSRTSSSAPFVARYRPALALVSVGRANRFGHPAPDVEARLHAAGANIFRTDEGGAVVIETDGRRVDARAMSGRRWGMRVWRQGA